MRTTVDDFGPYALSLGVGIMVVAIAVLIIGNMVTSSYYIQTWSNLTVGASNVTNVPYRDAGLVSVTCWNCTTQVPSTTVGVGVNGTDFAWWMNGTIQMWSAGFKAGCSGGVTNQKSCNFNYQAQNATAVLNAGQDALVQMANFFNIIGIVIVATVILGLVMLLRHAGIGGTA